MERLTALIGVTALTAAVGLSTAAPVHAATQPQASVQTQVRIDPESIPPYVVSAADQVADLATAGLTGRKSFQRSAGLDKDGADRRHSVESAGEGKTGTMSDPKASKAFELLVTKAVLKENPDATAEDIDRILLALVDITEIIAAVDPADVTRVAEGVTEVVAAVAILQSTGSPDAARRIVCGSGDAAAGSLSILADVVRMYEKSKNLPQIAEILNLLDPTTPEGAALYKTLPKELQTPQLKAGMVTFTKVGRALNKIDKQEAIGLAKDWAEAAATCNTQSLLKIPSLALRTFKLAREVLAILADADVVPVGDSMLAEPVRTDSSRSPLAR